MRLLFYHTARSWSGDARAFAAAARGLHARGHEVLFVCPPDSAVEAVVSANGHEVVPLRTDGSWMGTAWRLRRVLARRGIEVAFVHTEREQKIASLAGFLAGRCAVLRRVASGGAPALEKLNGLATRLAPTGVVVASTEDLHDLPVLERLRFDPVAAPLGVAIERYDSVQPVSRPSLGALPQGPLAVAVCDGGARVRAATMLRALSKMAPNHPDLRLAIVGPGSDDEDFRMHAAALGLTTIVTFAGERDDYLTVLQAADLGWVIATGDAAAFACLDFMALKVPVLAERTPLASTYVADGITGLLLPSADAPATAAALARLLAHDDKRLAMGHAGRARVAREFTEDAMISAFETAAATAADRANWKRS